MFCFHLNRGMGVDDNEVTWKMIQLRCWVKYNSISYDAISKLSCATICLWSKRNNYWHHSRFTPRRKHSKLRHVSPPEKSEKICFEHQNEFSRILLWHIEGKFTNHRSERTRKHVDNQNLFCKANARCVQTFMDTPVPGKKKEGKQIKFRVLGGMRENSISTIKLRHRKQTQNALHISRSLSHWYIRSLIPFFSASLRPSRKLLHFIPVFLVCRARSTFSPTHPHRLPAEQKKIKKTFSALRC